MFQVYWILNLVTQERKKSHRNTKQDFKDFKDANNYLRTHVNHPLPLFLTKLHKQNTHTDTATIAKPVVMTTIRKKRDYRHKPSWHSKINHTHF